MDPTNPKILFRNLVFHKIKKKTESKKRNGEKCWASDEGRKRASWIKKQKKVVEILRIIKIKKRTWTRHIMSRFDNRWTTKVTERQPRNRESQGKQRIISKCEIKAFTAASWRARQQTGRNPDWGNDSVLQWTSNVCCWWWWWVLIGGEGASRRGFPCEISWSIS